MSDREYLFNEAEYAYLLFALDRPEIADEYLKNIHPRMKWEEREELLEAGKVSLLSRGLIMEDEEEDEVFSSMVADPDLREVFEYGFPSDKALHGFISTPDEGGKAINIFFREDGGWMMQTTFQTEDCFYCGLKSGEGGIPDLIVGLAGISKPAAPELPNEIRKIALTAIMAAVEGKKVKQILRTGNRWGREIVDAFTPTVLGMFSRLNRESGEIQEDAHILFLEGNKYCWVFQFDDAKRSKGEILPGGVDRLKAEIANLVD